MIRTFEIVPCRVVEKPYGMKTVRVRERDAQYFEVYRVAGKRRELEMELDTRAAAMAWIRKEEAHSSGANEAAS